MSTGNFFAPIIVSKRPFVGKVFTVRSQPAILIKTEVAL